MNQSASAHDRRTSAACRIPALRHPDHIMEGVEDQQGVTECRRRLPAEGRTVEQLHEGWDAVPTQHGAEELDGSTRPELVGHPLLASHRGQIGDLHLGAVVDARWHAVGEQLHQVGPEPGVCGVESGDHLDDLGRGQCGRRDAEACPLGFLHPVVVEHPSDGKPAG